MLYTTLKITHLTCVLLTYLLFLTRGVWLVRDPQALSKPWVRVVPHVVDTVLLGSAIGLVLITRQYPGEQVWLTVKIIALVLYIALGLLAFRVCRKRATRLAAWITAQLVFVYIVLVALTRTPLLI